ncbi:hypothetical protein FRC15_000608 [Serendipita sp. 397]|nr:hypothetical protein FRC15_000608 [Serendipita sp. 397]
MASDTPYAHGFITQVSSGVAPKDALNASITGETELRRLFATEPDHSALNDPYIGLVDVFSSDDVIRRVQAREVGDQESNPAELDAKYVFPLKNEQRLQTGHHAIAASLDQFRSSWNIFTEGALSQLTDWNNVVAGGGAVLASLLPLPGRAQGSKRAIRKYFHEDVYSTSDIDLFLYGLTPEQAEKKIVQIYEAVRDSVPWDTVCAHRYEVRLAKYALRGFEVHVPNLSRKDIDPTIYERSINRIEGLARLLVLERLSDADDRTKYLEKRRALRGRPETQGYSRRAMRRRKKVKGDLKAEMEMFGGLNPSDYGTQSFHIPYGPGFDAKKLIKVIYSTDLGMNSTFNPKNRDRRLHRHPAFFGNITEVMEDCCEYCPQPITEEEKELQVEEDKTYIRGRLEFMVEDPGRQLMTGSFHPIDEGEWSTQAYLGDVEKLFQAIASSDMETVRDIVEGGFDLQRRDHVGRTSLHLALLAQNEVIASYLIDAGARITARLVDGRTSLHLASQYGMPGVVTKLIERSKQNEAKAEEEKRAAEALAKAEKKDHDGDSEMGDFQEDNEDLHASSEDDWDSDEDASSGKKKKAKKDEDPTTAASQVPAEGAAIPEDDEELPDILDINVPDWDILYSPLCHAIVAGQLSVVDILIRAGADVHTPFKKGAQTWSMIVMYPLTLTLLTEDEITACAIAERLIEGGATCTAADETLKTVFHRAVLNNSLSIVRTFLRADPNAKVAMDFMPAMGWNQTATPLVSAVGLNNRAMAALLIAGGSKLQITEEMSDRSWEARQKSLPSNAYRPQKEDGQWLKEINLPVESALACQSNLVFPLIELGADINVGVKGERSSYGITFPSLLLDAVRKSIRNLESTVKGYTELASRIIQDEPTSYPHEQWTETDNSLIGWLTSQVKNYAILKLEEDKKRTKEGVATQLRNEISPMNMLERTAFAQLDWLKQVEKSIIAHGGKTRLELYPEALEEEEQDRNVRPFPVTPSVSTEIVQARLPVEYRVYRGGNGNDAVPTYLTEQYAQLFEACWKGDHATVERLCLPPKTGVPKKDATYLQVTAFIQRTAKLDVYKAGRTFSYTSPVMSTLAVAIAARQWNTAKVILAIALAQYEKLDSKEPKYQLELDSDEDSDSDVSMDSDEDEISKPIMIDLARRMSTVKVPVEPKRLFESSWIIHGSTVRLATPIDHALQDADADAIKHILELGDLCEPKQELLPHHLQSVLASDSPEILDLVIRRYGYGIQVEEENDAESEHGDGPKVSKIYLGLNVDGKKRKDLASKADPDAPRQTSINSLPIIWRAAQMNKTKILSWLASPAPLESYKYYMANSTHENAKAMKRIRDFEQRLPALLGAAVTDIGENAVVACLQNEALLDTLKHLFAIFPGLKTTFVHGRLKGLETTALHQICGANLSTDIFDFFIGMGADPLATDFERRNIIHHLVNKDAYDLLAHVCTKLSNDQLAILFSQQTKSQMNTPLHLAVKLGRLRMIGLLTAFDHPVAEAILILRNAEGSTPLHIAIANGYKEIVVLLLDKGMNASSKTLCIENGIGSTPLEIAAFLRLLDVSNSGLDNQGATPGSYSACYPYDFDPDRNWGQLPLAQYRLNSLRDKINSLGDTNKITFQEAQALDQLLQSLDTEGRFIGQPEMRRVLFEYTASCHSAVQQWEEMSQLKKEFSEQGKGEGDSESDSKITEERLKEIKDKLVARTYLRSDSPMLMNAKTQPAQDTRDVNGTYKVIKSAIDSSPFKRRRELVHLLDAQKAVDAALDFATANRESRSPFQFGQQSDSYRYLTPKQRLAEMERQELDAEEEAAYQFLLQLGWLLFDA